MRRVELKNIPVRRSNPLAGWEQKVHIAALVLFLVAALVVWLRLWIMPPILGQARWPDGILLVFTVATTLASLSRHLPAQNAIFGAVVIGVFGAAAEILAAITAVPFGPISYNPAQVGQYLFYPLPWAVPLIWVVTTLNARGVARLVLRRFRHRPNYGFWVIGMTVLLVVLFELGFEPYATIVKQYWSWKPTRLGSSWFGTPWSDFLGAAVVSLLILLFVTPILINKSPVNTAPAWHPLLVWELAFVLFLTGAAGAHLRAVALLNGCLMVTVALCCVFGNRPGSPQQPYRT